MRWLRQTDSERRFGRRHSPTARGRALRRAAIAHAAELLKPVFREPFADEVFLAGGAFKPLIKPDHPVRDLDLWVRNRKVRERLCAHLMQCGAELEHDFHPYCIKFSHGETEIEITYQNVNDGPITDVLEKFDIAACSVAATYQNCRVTDCTITRRAERSLLEGELLLNEGYINHLETKRSPDVLQSIDRITLFAENFGMDVPAEICERLWEVFETVYTREEREACVDTYLRTTVSYKGRCDLHLLRRASGGVDAESLEA